MRDARLHLHGDLADLLRRRPRSPVLAVPVTGRRSVKDAVESLGVPHTEVGAVLVDGVDVDWDTPLRGGEHVQVHPVGSGPAGRVRPAPPPRPLRLVADVHLGTLARRLRVLGLDTWWRNDAADAELADLAARGPRVLLTRDRGLLMRSAVVHGALVRPDDPAAQLVEVVGRLLRPTDLDPGTRCPACNGRVEQVPADRVAARLERGTRAAGHVEVGRCTDCGQLYWPGAHANALAGIVALARGALAGVDAMPCGAARGRPARPRRGPDGCR